MSNQAMIKTLRGITKPLSYRVSCPERGLLAIKLMLESGPGYGHGQEFGSCGGALGGAFLAGLGFFRHLVFI